MPSIILFIASTHGNGNPPVAALNFFKELHSLRDVCCVQYCVFALGNSAYPQFCKFGVDLDNLLSICGAKRFKSLQKADAKASQQFVFDQWMEDILNAFDSNQIIGDEDEKSGFLSSGDNLMASVKERSMRELDSSVKLGKNSTMTKVSNNRTLIRASSKPQQLSGMRRDMSIFGGGTFRLQSFRAQSVFGETQAFSLSLASLDLLPRFLAQNIEESVKTFRKAKILPDVRELIVPVNDERSMKLVKFDISKTNSSYHIGGHVLIRPLSRLEDVNYVLSRTLDYYDSEEDLLTRVNSYGYEFKSGAEFIRTFYDFTKPLPFEDVRGLAVHCSDSIEAESILVIAEDAEEDRFLRLQDLMRLHHSLRPTLRHLLSTIPLMQPRIFSVSSCPILYPNELHVTLRRIFYHSEDGTARYGACSWSLLETRQPECYYSIMDSEFRPPADRDANVIMVSAGSGIAPFRGFWQERSMLPGSGETWLYHGCRDRSEFLFHDEIEHLALLQTLRVIPAYSRMEGGGYVQQFVAEDSERLLEMFLSGNAYLFVCGDIKISMEIERILVEQFISNGYGNYQDGLAFITSLQVSGRYRIEVFGSKS